MRRSVGISTLRLGVTACALMALVCALVPATATGVTTPQIEQKRREAAQAQERLDDLATQLELRSEEYAQIVEELARTRVKVAETRDELEAAQRSLDAAQSALSDRAARIYRTSDVVFVDVLFGVRDFGDLLSWFDFMRHLARSDAMTVASVQEGLARVESIERELETREAEQTALRAKARAKRDEVTKAVSEQRAYVKNLTSDIATLVREEQARQARLAAERARRAAEAAARAAAAQAAAAAAARDSKGSSSSAEYRFDPGTLGSGHPEIVAIALKYVGVPYVWGGSSPERGFDCSGLTQYVYAKAGLTIPRTSRSQFAAGRFISASRLDLLQTGDLVFFGVDRDVGRIHHVGIYVGSGNYLHAPQTGQNVQVSSLTARIASRGDYVGGCRF